MIIARVISVKRVRGDTFCVNVGAGIQVERDALNRSGHVCAYAQVERGQCGDIDEFAVR